MIQLNNFFMSISAKKVISREKLKEFQYFNFFKNVTYELKFTISNFSPLLTLGANPRVPKLGSFIKNYKHNKARDSKPIFLFFHIMSCGLIFNFKTKFKPPKTFIKTR